MDHHPPPPLRQNTNLSTNSANWSPNASGGLNNGIQSNAHFNDPNYTGYDEQDLHPPGHVPTASATSHRSPTLPRARNPASKYGAGRASFAPPKSTGDLRMWRHDERGNMWTKGSGGRVFGRFCCCTLLLVPVIVVSIGLTLALWLRPPNITFKGVQLPTSGSGVSVQQDGLHIDLQLGLNVKNPNFFAASFSAISAKIFYPPLQPQIGGGTLEDITFPANSNTDFVFPFSIKYTTAVDPTKILTTDLVNKCGIKPGSAKQKLNVKYELSLGLKILFFTIKPSFSGTSGFDCPVSRADLVKLGGEELLEALGAT